MTLYRACDCFALYCHHNPLPFPKHKTWDGTLWVMFSRYRWYRWLRGGIWQKFDASYPKSNHPYEIWLQVTRELPQALEVERYGKRLSKGGGK